MGHLHNSCRRPLISFLELLSRNRLIVLAPAKCFKLLNLLLFTFIVEHPYQAQLIAQLQEHHFDQYMIYLANRRTETACSGAPNLASVSVAESANGQPNVTSSQVIFNVELISRFYFVINVLLHSKVLCI
ncbi:unnamed protein product [Protopolystoma xenopodis]|uniref:Uncharacterized protein n=1 Tax=Protopolystoma xenopodis TaxID=117903 RepID=A0A448XRW4_9PLAT|nr:unnamed protein product [Protopolystoma xenopodis]